MRRSTKDDAIDWFGALERSSADARRIASHPTLGPPNRCLCGSDDPRGRIIASPVDLTDASGDLAVVRNEGIHPCRACQHYVQHGAMSIQHYHSATSTVRDRYHPDCVRF